MTKLICLQLLELKAFFLYNRFDIYNEVAQMPNLETEFIPPEDENAKIWRYMDFPKFVSFLMSKSLYFSRSDLLGDPFEGSYPEFNKEFRVQRDKMFLEQLLGDRVTTDSVNTFLESQSNLNKFLAKCMCVNCWHINEDESFAMWSIYAKDNKGIAIQSTYKQLRTSLPPSILIGKVTYIDYQKEHISEFRVFDPIMHKRKSFMFENELRAVKSILGAFLPTITESLVEVPSVGPDIKGVSIPVDIDKLISSIYVAPNSEDWFFDVVSEVTKQYSLTINVCKSPLDKEPYY